jgi:hypothetical protein
LIFIYIGIIAISSCFSISPVWFLTLIGDKIEVLWYIRFLVVILIFGVMLCRMEQHYEDIVAAYTYCWTCALFWNSHPNWDCFLWGYWPNFQLLQMVKIL